MYHAIGCLTLPKLYISLGEHSEASKRGHFTRAQQEYGIMTA